MTSRYYKLVCFLPGQYVPWEDDHRFPTMVDAHERVDRLHFKIESYVIVKYTEELVYNSIGEEERT